MSNKNPKLNQPTEKNKISFDEATRKLYKERIMHYCDVYLKIRKAIDERKGLNHK